MQVFRQPSRDTFREERLAQSGPCQRAAADRPSDETRQGWETLMKYDLILTGGEVIDPAAGLRGVMDIGIAGGKIAAVAPALPANEALRAISAKGRIVTPG